MLEVKTRLFVQNLVSERGCVLFGGAKQRRSEQGTEQNAGPLALSKHHGVILGSPAVTCPKIATLALVALLVVG